MKKQKVICRYFPFLLLMSASCFALPSGEPDFVQTPFRIETQRTTYPDGGNWSEDHWKFIGQNYLEGGGIYKASVNNTAAFSGDERVGLVNRNTTAVHVSSNGNYVGTLQGGIYKFNSTKYEPKSSGLPQNCTINDIEESNSILYVATDNGVFKSSDLAESWSSAGLGNSTINCLFASGTSIFAGTDGDKVFRTDDGGQNWMLKSSGIGTGDDSKIIDFTKGNGFLFIVVRSGFVYSSVDDGDNWVKKASSQCADPGAIEFVDPPGLSDEFVFVCNKGSNQVQFSTDDAVSFPYQMVFDGNMPIGVEAVDDLCSFITGGQARLVSATDKGVFISIFSSGSWGEFMERSLGEDEPEKINRHVKKLHVNSTSIYAGLSKKDLYPGAELVYDTGADSPLHPKHWEMYNCHAFAWHISEGGEGWPDEVKYNDGYIEIPQTIVPWDKSYHRIEVTDPDFGELWEKIAYSSNGGGVSYGHTGIRDPLNPGKVISKWHQELPLVRHDQDVLYGFATLPRHYYTASKKVSGTAAANEYVKIGRRILSTQTVQAGNDVKYEIAQMNDGNIILKGGFHAQAGTTFHAFTSGVGAPYLKSVNGKISVWDKEDAEAVKASGQMEIYPNPASDFIIVKPGKLYESDSFRRMNVYLYNSEGVEIYGWHEMKAGETEIPVSFLSPGAYFIRIVLLSGTQENKVLTNKFMVE